MMGLPGEVVGLGILPMGELLVRNYVYNTVNSATYLKYYYLKYFKYSKESKLK